MSSTRKPIIVGVIAFVAMALLPERSYVVPVSEAPDERAQPEAQPVLDLVDDLVPLD